MAETDVGAETIEELFARNPLDLTKDDRQAIVEHMREKRKIFNQPKTKKAAKKKAAPRDKKAARVRTQAEIDQAKSDLADLGL